MSLRWPDGEPIQSDNLKWQLRTREDHQENKKMLLAGWNKSQFGFHRWYSWPCMFVYQGFWQIDRGFELGVCNIFQTLKTNIEKKTLVKYYCVLYNKSKRSIISVIYSVIGHIGLDVIFLLSSANQWLTVVRRKWVEFFFYVSRCYGLTLLVLRCWLRTGHADCSVETRGSTMHLT